MPIEFNNMKVIGDFDKNNFSGTVRAKTLQWEPKT